jgi:hypothetical protein
MKPAKLAQRNVEIRGELLRATRLWHEAEDRVAELKQEIAVWVHRYDGLLDSFRGVSQDPFGVKDRALQYFASNGFVVPVAIAREALEVFVACLVKMFAEFGADNYLEATAGNEAGDEFVITIQKRDGLTPHTLRQIAENERDSWKEAADFNFEEYMRVKNKILSLVREFDPEFAPPIPKIADPSAEIDALVRKIAGQHERFGNVR